MSPLPGRGGEDLWVFGYGSLMWRPGFAFEERRLARLHGLRRALCIHSYVHRGTPQRPGLVLGLDRGGSCRGVAFRVAAERRTDTVAYLREREQVTGVYLEGLHSVRLDDGRRVQALAYRADRRHAQYAGAMEPKAVLAVVRAAAGQSGANPDYVLSTADHLAELGIRDATLEWIAARLRAPGT